MIIGVLREAKPGETRVAATPATVAQLIQLGYEVIVDPGAGVNSDYDIDAYTAAGARAGEATSADIVIGVNTPSAEQIAEQSADQPAVQPASPAEGAAE